MPPPPPPPPPPNLLCLPFGKKARDADSMTEKSFLYETKSQMSAHSWTSTTPSQQSLVGSQRTRTQTYYGGTQQSYRSTDDLTSMRSGTTDPNGARLVRSGTRPALGRKDGATRLSFDSARTDYNSALAHNPADATQTMTTSTQIKKRNTLRKGLFGWGSRKKEKEQVRVQEMQEVAPPPMQDPAVDEALLDADIDDGSEMIAPLPILQRGGQQPLSRQTSGRSQRTAIMSPPPPPRPSGSGNALPRRPSVRSHDSQSTLVGSAYERKIADEGRVFARLDTSSRLEDLRTQMQKNNIDYYIVPSEDSHLSEYVAPGDKRRQWISGFSGSSGQAIISANNAYLVTDSRYWLQAEKELDSNWQLLKAPDPETGMTDWTDFLIARTNGARVGMDTRLIAHGKATDLVNRLQATSSKLVYLSQNLVDLIWKDRPQRSKNPIFLHPTEFAGESAYSKIHKLRTWITMQPPKITGGYKRPEDMPKSYYHVATLLTQLDSIAYLLNLRGQDIEFSPVFQAYFFLSFDNAYLFVETEKIQDDVRTYLDTLHIEIREYSEFWKFLNRREWGEGKVLITPQTPYAITLILTSFRWTIAPDFVAEMKAIKNPTEIAGMRKAYLRDAVAFVRFLAWLEEKIKNKYEITEFEAAHRIDEYRYKSRNFMGPAYETISASGPNAALPHYIPTKGGSRFIDKLTPYLNDSGGQYRDGTCDTTRTIHLGRPTVEQCEAFTRVLKGHIAIDTAVFPDGTTGKQLDILARNALWKQGMNYGHGTGHGIGSFLNVHEGPQGFGIDVPICEGHVLTNEPGFYKDGQWGVRIESALVVKRAKLSRASKEDMWLGFERLTWVPIQGKMVKEDMLSQEEKDWMKRHNEQCRDKLIPLLGEDRRAIQWIKRQAERGFGPSKTVGGVAIDWD